MSQKKQIFKLSFLRKLLEDENSCVSLMQSTRLLALPPFYLHDMKSGILYLLNAMLKKYDRSLGGIVMGYQNIKVLMDENTGIIPIGTSEIEVNISVDFYIFQPKIGSYLEGIINKKSNNHIGCLVHQYFNATILKPEDVLYEDWNCKNFNVDDKIIFKVKDLDFTALLPLIEGIYDGKNSLDNIKSRRHSNCDIDNMVISNVNKSSQNEKSSSRESLMGTINTVRKSDDFSVTKKVKNKYEPELNEVNEKLNNDFGESQSLMDLKSFKKKKKKRKKEEIKFSADDTFKVNECLPSQDAEDNMLYSTQLDTNLGSKKMMMSFCSPIPQTPPFEEKSDAGSTPQNKESSVCPPNQVNVVATKMEMKKKHKKRKREKQEESEDSTTVKKIKTSNTSSSKEGDEAREEMNSGMKKSILENMMEQLLTEHINKTSKISSLMEEKIKKETKKKKIKAERNESLGTNGEERKSDVQSAFSELFIHELQRVKEELNRSNKEGFKKSKKTKAKNKLEVVKDMTGEESSKVRITPHAQINSSNGSCNKLDMKSMTDTLYKEEIDGVKEDIIKSDADSIKQKKRNSTANDPKSSSAKTHLLLYDKLLNDAKSAVDLEKCQKLIKPPAPELEKKKKDKYFSDVSTSSSGKKGSKKKSKHKKSKTETSQQTHNILKNGSMYDPAPTSQEIEPDKSMFSDSEHGASPVKRRKEINGDGTGSEKFLETNYLDEFIKEEIKSLKGKSNSSSLKNLSKNEKKWSKAEGHRKGQFSGEEEESLYEKLLRQAKSLIDDGGVTLIKNKEKKGKKKKKSDTEFC